MPVFLNLYKAGHHTEMSPNFVCLLHYYDTVAPSQERECLEKSNFLPFPAARGGGNDLDIILHYNNICSVV